jgi:two-component system cell cycle sensor histidine kinase/response regulator CckA
MGSDPDEVRSSTPTRPLTVLLVEDDPSVAGITTRWLKALNFEVIVSSDGRDALAQASRITTPIDLLLTDVMLPRMRGPVLADAVHRSHPEAAVLFTSGYSPELVAEISAPHTASALLLQKPFTADQLASSVAMALARKTATSNARSAGGGGPEDPSRDADPISADRG